MSSTVKVSADTLDILKVVQKINNSLKFTEGNMIRSARVNGSVLFEAEIQESFPQDFSIYEMNKFLSVLSLTDFKDSTELVFDNDSHLVVKAGSTKVKYFFAAESFTAHPGKTITLPKVDIEFDVTQETLASFIRAADALGHKTLMIRVVDGVLSLVATTPSTDSSNDYEVQLMEDVDMQDTYEAVIARDNFILYPGDYTVQVIKTPTKGLAYFDHMTRKIKTYIALEIDPNV